MRYASRSRLIKSDRQGSKMAHMIMKGVSCLIIVKGEQGIIFEPWEGASLLCQCSGEGSCRFGSTLLAALYACQDEKLRYSGLS